MERKLIKQGGGGYTVYLPKEWVIDNGLEKGDIIDIDIIGQNLRISQKPEKRKKSEICLEISGEYKDSIRVLVITAYRQGYDIIKVKISSKKQYNILKELIEDSIIGFEITSYNEGLCIIENITEPSQEQFDNIFRKLLLNIEELFEFGLMKMKNPSRKIKDFKITEKRIMQYDNFCRRILYKYRFDRKSSSLLSFMYKLGNIQREIFYANDVSKSYKFFSNATIKFMEDAFSLFKLLEEMILKKDMHKYKEIHDVQNELIHKRLKKLLNSSQIKEKEVIFNIAGCVRNISYSVSYALSYII